jgi:hypothetical protein
MSDLDRVRREMAVLSGKSGKKRLPSERVPDTSLAKMNRRKRRRLSRQKGASNERVVAKMFEKWYGKKVRRTPLSGGWSSAAFGVTGDLVCEDPHFPFHVECKKREDWQLDDLITGVRARDERSILAWWQQTLDTCPKDKEPLLVFTRNGKAQLILCRLKTFYVFCGDDTPTHFVCHLRRNNTTMSVVIATLSDFLTHIKWENIL